MDAKTGALAWKNLVPFVERYIGGHEQLESPNILTYNGRPIRQNILVADGLGYVAYDAEDPRKHLVFKPETGEIAPAPKNVPGGRRLLSDAQFSERVAHGNSLPRQYAEIAYAKLNDGRIRGDVVAFDDALSVAYNGGGGERDWRDSRGVPLFLTAVKDDPKQPGGALAAPFWKSQPIDLVVDDIVLTPQYAYCVGHYQRVAKSPELWVVSQEDGQVVNTIPVAGFPAFLGMSAAGNRLFVATREGKLICYQGAK